MYCMDSKLISSVSGLLLPYLVACSLEPVEKICSSNIGTYVGISGTVK